MRKPTNWDVYQKKPNTVFSRIFFMNRVIRGYSDLLKSVAYNKPIDILEFGSGTGNISKWLCKRFDVDKLVLMDSNRRMLNISKCTLSDISCKKKFIHKDFFEFESKTQYDIVHSQGVIEHFNHEKRLKLLKKHYESTKTGGFCIVYSPTPTISYRFVRRIAETLKLWKFSDEVPLKKDLIIEEMESLGFKAVKSNFFWKYYLTEVGIIFKKL